MNLTPEQQTILDFVSTYTGSDPILVDSVAGSGKTTLLTSIAKTLPHSKGLYLAYNKAVADASQSKFPHTTKCMTTHSLAYNLVVKTFRLKVADFNVRDIPNKSLSYENRLETIALIRAFCLSSAVDYNSFVEGTTYTNEAIIHAHTYLDMMAQGQLPVTHEAYLKMLHLHLLEGSLEMEPFDFIMLDEAGDLNEVTLEIFKLLPARIRIAVGDPYQNIYGFNHTINCFNVLQGHTFKMSQSFRVATPIAERIEAFCRTYIDPSMDFKGIPLRDTTIKTTAYIARTNAALISHMIELNKIGKPYGLTRSPKQLFEPIRALMYLSRNGTITYPPYKHVQEEVNAYYQLLENNPKAIHEKPNQNLLAYLHAAYAKDVAISNALTLIAIHGNATLENAYQEALKHTNIDQPYVLGTGHSTKGLEFDEVIIADDMNYSIETILKAIDRRTTDDIIISQEDREALNLYYVACTRAHKKLTNAIHLDPKPSKGALYGISDFDEQDYFCIL